MGRAGGRRPWLLTTRPWSRAPVALLRAPVTAVAVGGAAAIVAFVVASWPLFLASVSAASQDRQVAARCPSEIGATVVPTTGVAAGSPVGREDRLAAFEGAVTAVARATPGLGPPVRTAVAEVVLRTQAGDRGVRLMARDGGTRSVELTAGARRGGLLLPEASADDLALAPGDRASLVAGAREAPVAVAGSYRSPVAPLPPAWCSERERLLPAGFGADPPPPVVLVDRGLLAAVAAHLEVPLDVRWELPVRNGSRRDRVRALAPQLEGFERRLERALDPTTSVGASPERDAGAVRAVTSTLPSVVRGSRAVSEGLRSGLGPTVAGASAASTLLLVGTGWWWSDRRAGELALLRRLGTGHLLIGGKALLELLLPVLVGAVVGTAAATAVVTVVGPGGVPLPADVVGAAPAVAAAALAGLLGAGAVAGVRSALADRAGEARGPVIGRLPRVLPWLSLQVAVAVVIVVILGRGRPTLALGAARLDLDGTSFVLPILLIGAIAAACSGVVRLLAAAVGGRGAALPTAAWLALRRLVAAPLGPALFTACVAASVGVLVYADAASSSLERSLHDKAGLAVGADALVDTAGRAPLPRGIAGTSPVATTGGTQRSDPVVAVLGVDPSTAPDVVAHPGIDGGRLRTLLGALRAPGTRAPVLVVGGAAPADGVIRVASARRVDLPFEIVGKLDAFPGMSQSRTTVVVDIERLRALGIPLTERLWVRGEVAAVLDRLAAAGTPVASVRVPEQALDTATFLAVVWTFGFLRSLGVLGALLSAVGLLVHLDARHRSRVLAYGLARHMGLARTTHRRSILLELAAVVVPAAAAGAAAGTLTASLFLPGLDPLPRFAPETTSSTPWLAVAAAGALAVALCQLGAAVGQRAADRVHLATAVRHGG